MNETAREPAARRGSGPAPVEIAPQPRVATAVRLLFKGGFDTVEIAALLHRVEPEIVDLLHGPCLEGGS